MRCDKYKLVMCSTLRNAMELGQFNLLQKGSLTIHWLLTATTVTKTVYSSASVFKIIFVCFLLLQCRPHEVGDGNITSILLYQRRCCFHLIHSLVLVLLQPASYTRGVISRGFGRTMSSVSRGIRATGYTDTEQYKWFTDLYHIAYHTTNDTQMGLKQWGAPC
jgi:hypothetical protein